MKHIPIRVGFCVAYDWELLENSLPLVYHYADTICLSIDRNRKSWSGLPYEFDKQAFDTLIKSIDKDHKLDIYEDDFSLPDLSAIENDNRQRNMMAERMGKGGWHIQIDSDEYFINFKGFVNYLKSRDIDQKEINYCCPWISLIKRREDGYLYIPFSKQSEFMPFGSNKPNYSNARRNGYFNHLTPFGVIHETWARDEQSLRQKLQSWGHVNDFDKESYLKIWQALDHKNHKYINNFHPIKPEVWPKLEFLKANNIQELIEHFKNNPPIISSTYLRKKNSRLLAKLKSIFRAN